MSNLQETKKHSIAVYRSEALSAALWWRACLPDGILKHAVIHVCACSLQLLVEARVDLLACADGHDSALVLAVRLGEAGPRVLRVLLGLDDEPPRVPEARRRKLLNAAHVEAHGVSPLYM